MHHQTLLLPSSSSSPPPPPPPPPPSALFFHASSSSFSLPLCPLSPLPYSYCLQVEKEAKMEALKSSLRPAALSSEKQQLQHQSLGVLGEEPLWVDERGSLLGDLSIEDLLDLGDFGDNDKESDEGEAGELGEAGPGGAVEAAEHMETEKSSPDSSSPSSSSALTFEPLAPPSLPTLPDLSLPAHDAQEFEWVSYIVDDSCSEFPSCVGAPASLPPADSQCAVQRNNHAENHLTITAAPFQGAAVQGGASCFLGPTVCTVSTEAPPPVKAKRSKRPRTVSVGWSASGHLPFADSSSSSTTTSSASSCSSTSSPLSSCLIYDHHSSNGSGEQSLLLYESHPSLPPVPPQSKKPHKPKKRGRKPKTPPSSALAGTATAPSSGERRCSHCGVQKTPQWRAGPLGAKTLCNACGVRFKSGRLLPEYRPACSPTFVSSIHSNSHRKVLEMRRKKEGEVLAAAPSMSAVASF